MNIALTLEQYDNNLIYFCEPIRNNIMTNGTFVRILYSTSTFMLNGIYLHLPIGLLRVEKYFNKYKCMFDPGQYKDLLKRVQVLEEDLLRKIDIVGKSPHYKIHEQLQTGVLKFFFLNNILHNGNLVLKISGIWETDTEYGVTHKFLLY